jgi:hypothetical protein
MAQYFAQYLQEEPQKQPTCEHHEPDELLPATSSAASPSPEPDDTRVLFRKFWPSVTDDNPLTLFRFRRFKTVHLLNLRLLENEMTKFSRKMFIEGVGLGLRLPVKSDSTFFSLVLC